jgi:hypothetical protein
MSDSNLYDGERSLEGAAHKADTSVRRCSSTAWSGVFSATGRAAGGQPLDVQVCLTDDVAGLVEDADGEQPGMEIDATGRIGADGCKI